MRFKYRSGVAAGALAMGLTFTFLGSQAAPPAGGGSDLRTAAGDGSGVLKAHWDRDFSY